MHEPIEDRGAHRVIAQIRPPILYDAVGGDDEASAQFVALMDQWSCLLSVRINLACTVQ